MSGSIEKNKQKSYGYGRDGAENDVTMRRAFAGSCHLIKFGIIPEFIGRVPVVAALSELTKEDLVRVLKEPKNSIISQYEKMLKLEGVKFVFTDEAAEAVAEETIKKEIGARGLRSIIENIMMDIMYEVPSMKDVKKVVIDGDIVTGEKDRLDAIVREKTA